MEKPQLYNVQLSNCSRNNTRLISDATNIYNIPKDKLAKFIDDINSGRKTIVACVPLDIAKTLSDMFINSSNGGEAYTATVDLQLAGKFDERR